MPRWLPSTSLYGVVLMLRREHLSVLLNTGVVRAFRFMLSLLLGALAIPGVILVVGPPITLSQQAAVNRAYLIHFRQAERLVATFSADKGRFPDNEELQNISRGTELENWASNMYADTSRCGFRGEEHHFVKPPNDRFVLSFWAGEYFDCYSSPSGKTTLKFRVIDLIGWYDALFFIVGAIIETLLIFLAWASFPRGILGKALAP